MLIFHTESMHLNYRYSPFYLDICPLSSLRMLCAGPDWKPKSLPQELLLRKICEDQGCRISWLLIGNSKKMHWGGQESKPGPRRKMLIWRDPGSKKKIIQSFFRDKKLSEDVSKKELTFYNKLIKEQKKEGVSLKPRLPPKSKISHCKTREWPKELRLKPKPPKLELPNEEPALKHNYRAKSQHSNR